MNPLKIFSSPFSPRQRRCTQLNFRYSSWFFNFFRANAPESVTGRKHASAANTAAIPKECQDDRDITYPQNSFTTLPNGLRIATLPAYGKFCTVGVGISAGSRDEVRLAPGTAHFVEKLAFAGSKKYTRKDFLDLMHRCNALVDCQSSKDTFMYASSCSIKSAGEIISLISDAVFRPLITDEDMEKARITITFENEMMARNPDCEPLLTDWIHQAAFRGNTIGLPKYCSPENINAVTSADVLTFLNQYYTPKRIVLAGVGLPQQWLDQLGEVLFDESTATWSTNPERLLSQPPPVDESLAQYTGGELMIEKDLSKVALGPTPFPNLAHFVVAFNGASTTDTENFVPFCVLQMLMGGGGSFSAGGPGKGMYSRLYLDVLNQHGWMYNATAYNHSYADSGLFCIRASGHPDYMSELPSIILKEFVRLANEPVRDEELDRAKIQLKSQLLMNLEMRPVQFEDMCRQILVHNKIHHPLEYCAMIDRVSATDIQRIGRRMLESPMSVVGYGNLANLPPFQKISALVL